MTAAARKHAPRPDPVAVFTLRAQARALLWQAGELDLHTAVDELQAAAERDGLVAAVGQDAVQAVMAQACSAVRDDQVATSVHLKFEGASSGALEDDYDGLPATFAALCRAADEKQKPPDPHIERARRLLAADVTLERAWHEINKRAPGDVPTATLQAAELLLQQKDRACLRAWLDRHGAAECKAILQHLEQRKRARAS